MWVPACATGEEAYSLAMLLMEQTSQVPNPPDFQIFATDIDERSIAVARAGLYPQVIESDMSPERLHHFFTREDCIAEAGETADTDPLAGGTGSGVLDSAPPASERCPPVYAHAFPAGMRLLQAEICRRETSIAVALERALTTEEQEQLLAACTLIERVTDALDVDNSTARRGTGGDGGNGEIQSMRPDSAA